MYDVPYALWQFGGHGPSGDAAVTYESPDGRWRVAGDWGDNDQWWPLRRAGSLSMSLRHHFVNVLPGRSALGTCAAAGARLVRIAPPTCMAVPPRNISPARFGIAGSAYSKR
jgi:hypothetical protein